MFCKNCGNVIPDNASSCDRCGAPTGVNGNYEYGERVLSKKEYFKSRLMSDRAKNMKTANWALFGILTAGIAFLILICTLFAALMPLVVDSFDLSGGFVGFVDAVNEMNGTELYTQSEMEEFALVDKELEEIGMTLTDIFDLFPIVFGVLAVLLIGVFVVLLIAVKNKNTGCAIAFTVICTFTSSLFTIGCAIAILVMTILLNKEYKEYTQNLNVFNISGGNEPNFS